MSPMAIHRQRTYYFGGIGGSGMSAIAQILRSRQHSVHGSDRNYDNGRNQRLFDQLKAQGIKLYPQDGSGINPGVDEIVVSTAIEHDNPEILRANQLKIPIIKRAEILARLLEESNGIAVGGTSGKSTVTAMIGCILAYAGRNPTIINGGNMINFASYPFPGNAVCGDPSLCVIEADESDGTIEHYSPDISVVTNISRDHKPLDELYDLFCKFLNKTRSTALVNINCMTRLDIASFGNHLETFGLEQPDSNVNAYSPRLTGQETQFVIEDVTFQLPLPGRHNIVNATAAVATCIKAGVTLAECARALKGFSGVVRRMQKIGEVDGVTVIDDFAHNPDKIRATLSTLKLGAQRLLVMFQPHGFTPMLFVKDGLIKVFSEILDSHDFLAIPEIYYVGGTAPRTISSRDLVQPIAALGINARYFSTRLELIEPLVKSAKTGDVIVIMGARDDTLSDFAQKIFTQLTIKSKTTETSRHSP